MSRAVSYPCMTYSKYIIWSYKYILFDLCDFWDNTGTNPIRDSQKVSSFFHFAMPPNFYEYTHLFSGVNWRHTAIRTYIMLLHNMVRAVLRQKWLSSKEKCTNGVLCERIYLSLSTVYYKFRVSGMSVLWSAASLLCIHKWKEVQRYLRVVGDDGNDTVVGDNNADKRYW